MFVVFPYFVTTTLEQIRHIGSSVFVGSPLSFGLKQCCFRHISSDIFVDASVKKGKYWLKYFPFLPRRRRNVDELNVSRRWLKCDETKVRLRWWDETKMTNRVAKLSQLNAKHIGAASVRSDSSHQPAVLLQHTDTHARARTHTHVEFCGWRKQNWFKAEIFPHLGCCVRFRHQSCRVHSVCLLFTHDAHLQHCIQKSVSVCLTVRASPLVTKTLNDWQEGSLTPFIPL